MGCSFSPSKSYQNDLSWYSEDNIYFSEKEFSRVKEYIPDGKNGFIHLSEQLSWLGQEEQWHYNCLFLKPIRYLDENELPIAIGHINLLTRAKFEIKNKAYDVAGKMLRDSADEGFPLANVELAKMLMVGLGIPPNPESAHTLLLRAAYDNCAIAQFELAKHLVSFGDKLRAWGWVELAVKQGYKPARDLMNTLEDSMNPVQLQLAKSYQNSNSKNYRYLSWKQSFRPVECVYTKARIGTAFKSSYYRCIKVGGTPQKLIDHE